MWFIIPLLLKLGIMWPKKLFKAAFYKRLWKLVKLARLFELYFFIESCAKIFWPDYENYSTNIWKKLSKLRRNGCSRIGCWILRARYIFLQFNCLETILWNCKILWNFKKIFGPIMQKRSFELKVEPDIQFLWWWWPSSWV